MKFKFKMKESIGKNLNGTVMRLGHSYMNKAEVFRLTYLSGHEIDCQV